MAKTLFDAEKTANDHEIETFLVRKQNDGIAPVEVGKDNDAVIFSHAGGR